MAGSEVLRSAAGFHSGLRAGLFDEKHYRAMGDAVWLFGWLITRETQEADGQGLVLGGADLSYDAICRDTGYTLRNVQRWMMTLRRTGYVETRRVAHRGIKIKILKAKKFHQYPARNGGLPQSIPPNVAGYPDSIPPEMAVYPPGKPPNVAGYIKEQMNSKEMNRGEEAPPENLQRSTPPESLRDQLLRIGTSLPSMTDEQLDAMGSRMWDHLMNYCRKFGADRQAVLTPEGREEPPELPETVAKSMGHLGGYRFFCELAQGKHPKDFRWIRKEFLSEFVKESKCS